LFLASDDASLLIERMALMQLPAGMTRWFQNDEPKP
jgi:hypothetical protein